MTSLSILRAGPAVLYRWESPCDDSWKRSPEENVGSSPSKSPFLSHCGVGGNERADSVTRDAAALLQRDVTEDSRNICRAMARAARGKTVEKLTARMVSMDKDLKLSGFGILPASTYLQLVYLGFFLYR